MSWESCSTHTHHFFLRSSCELCCCVCVFERERHNRVGLMFMDYGSTKKKKTKKKGKRKLENSEQVLSTLLYNDHKLSNKQSVILQMIPKKRTHSTLCIYILHNDAFTMHKSFCFCCCMPALNGTRSDSDKKNLFKKATVLVYC